MPDLPITPQTKVAELLAAYPELEEVLVSMAPASRKLRNPVLRRTVARLATLETAAGMGGLTPRDLVRRLREAVGQPLDGDAGEAGGEPLPVATATEVPDWAQAGAVTTTVDADALLAQGQMPLTEVLAHARQLTGSDLVRVTVAFPPTPMVDALEKQGLRACLRRGPEGGYELLVGPG